MINLLICKSRIIVGPKKPQNQIDIAIDKKSVQVNIQFINQCVCNTTYSVSLNLKKEFR